MRWDLLGFSRAFIGIPQGRYDSLYEIWGCFNRKNQRAWTPRIFCGPRGGKLTTRICYQIQFGCVWTSRGWNQLKKHWKQDLQWSVEWGTIFASLWHCGQGEPNIPGTCALAASRTHSWGRGQCIARQLERLLGWAKMTNIDDPLHVMSVRLGLCFSVLLHFSHFALHRFHPEFRGQICEQHPVLVGFRHSCPEPDPASEAAWLGPTTCHLISPVLPGTGRDMALI